MKNSLHYILDKVKENKHSAFILKYQTQPFVS